MVCVPRVIIRRHTHIWALMQQQQEEEERRRRDLAGFLISSSPSPLPALHGIVSSAARLPDHLKEKFE